MNVQLGLFTIGPTSVLGQNVTRMWPLCAGPVIERWSDGPAIHTGIRCERMMIHRNRRNRNARSASQNDMGNVFDYHTDEHASFMRREWLNGFDGRK